MRLGNRDQAAKYVDQISSEFSMFTERTLKPLAKYMKYITKLQKKNLILMVLIYGKTVLHRAF